MGELTDSGDSVLDAASEIRQELELHVAQCAAELERSGMSRVEAIAEANRRFGNFDSHFEACRREAPEERMNRAMKIGMVAMTVLLLAAVAYLGAIVAMQRHALNEMKHFVSEFSADPIEVALAEARMAGAVPEATLAGQVAKPGAYPVDPDGGTEAEAFLRSAGICWRMSSRSGCVCGSRPSSRHRNGRSPGSARGFRSGSRSTVRRASRSRLIARVPCAFVRS